MIYRIAVGVQTHPPGRASSMLPAPTSHGTRDKLVRGKVWRMNIVFYMHSGIRYLVLLAAVAALAYLLYGMALRRDFDKLAGALTGAYVGLMDVQVLIGVVLYLLIPSYPALMGHVVMMLAAVTVAHVASIMNKRREKKSYGVALGGVVVSLLLIVGGIMSIGRALIGSGGL